MHVLDSSEQESDKPRFEALFCLQTSGALDLHSATPHQTRTGIVAPPILSTGIVGIAGPHGQHTGAQQVQLGPSRFLCAKDGAQVGQAALGPDSGHPEGKLAKKSSRIARQPHGEGVM